MATPFLIVVLVVLIPVVNLVQLAPVDAETPSWRGGPDFARATPVPIADERSDPLDGDPLDGPPRAEDARDAENEDLAPIEIVRSGRPADAPGSQPAYDGDPKTEWTVNADGEAAWVWFDLGEEQPLREVRWLARGSGAIEVATSDDRESWRDAGSREVRPGWQGIALEQDARYVRLTLTPDEDGTLPALAEVTAYGPDNGDGVSRQQRAKDKNDERDNERNRTRDDRSRERERDRGNVRRATDRDRGAGQAEASPGVSAEPGETRCRGKRAKCEAKEGRVSVEEDCEREGTCVIDVQADGGTAICDASGPDEAAAGRGEGKRGADGGRCEAVANGGTVTIGDINP